MNTGLLLLIVTVAVALIFDFLNGFHDAANSIATVVSTRVLSPKLAVIWAAFFNFVAAFLLGTAVAKTIGKGMIRLDDVTQYVVIAGLAGAIVWDLLTWWWGLPTSSSHALIGGYAGAAMARAALNHGIAQRLFRDSAPRLDPDPDLHRGGSGHGTGSRALVFFAPAIGCCATGLPGQVDKWFRKLQLLSAAAYSLGHGGNDAQKTMGIIAGALFTAGYMTPEEITHEWGRYKWFIILSAHTAIALGTYFGGWRIVHTMGSKITKLKPLGGFCAESAGALTLFGTALAGIPVSTTHTITGAIIGVGAVHRLSAVRWGVARRIVWAWMITIPASGAVAGLVFWIIRLVYPAA